VGARTDVYGQQVQDQLVVLVERFGASVHQTAEVHPADDRCQLAPGWIQS